MMSVNQLNADIVISVSGGVVTEIFAPQGANVLLIDFDNIRGGDDISITAPDESPDSKECKATIKEAREMIASHDRGRA